MSKTLNKWQQRLADAVSNKKPEKASLVVYDKDGHQLFEMYGGSGSFIKARTAATDE